MIRAAVAAAVRAAVLICLIGACSAPGQAMTRASAPAKFSVPFANAATSGFINYPLPTASQIGVTNCAASLADGFPPKSMQPASAGGCAPFGQDMNGIIKQITQWNQQTQAGAVPAYDSAFSSSIGGYPVGAILSQASNAACFWISQGDNNATDPDTGGGGWTSACPGGGAGGTSTGSNVNQQAFTTTPFVLAKLARVCWTAGHTNTSSLQINVNSGGLTNLYQRTTSGLAALSGGEVQAGMVACATYDGTQYELDTSAANASTVSANTFYAPQYFSGMPWADVRSGANGCAAAVGNGSTDDTAAIQCQINYMNSTYSGGIVYAPPGVYLVSGGGITIKGGVQLLGSGQNSTTLEVTTNSQVAAWDSSCKRGTSLQSLSVFGYISTSASTSVVHVYNNCPVIIRDATIWGGIYALNNQGVDSYIENSFICAVGSTTGGASVVSNGANWYVRDKIDTCGYSVTYAFYQGAPISGLAVAENHFVQSDFSGSYSYSVYINDGGTGTAITTFQGGVFSAPILISNAKVTMFTAAELGSTSFASNNSLSIVGSFAFNPTTISGSGARSCSGNVNVSC